MKILTVALLACLLAAAPAHAIMIWDYPTSPNGLSATALANPNVDGGLIKVRMGTVETLEGQYDWSGVQAEIAKLKAAGKLYELDSSAAWSAPQWVYQDGAQSFTWVWNQTWGMPICSTAKAPVPWDHVYLRKYRDFIDAMAAQFGSDPSLYAVKLDGIGASTDETLLPRSVAGTSINNGECFSMDDTADWVADGYTEPLVRGAFDTLARRYQYDFPNIATDLMIVPFGFPNDSPVVNETWGATEDDLTADCESLVIHCNIQNNGWNQKWGLTWDDNNRPVTVWQEVGTLGSAFPQAANLAAQEPELQWAEVYEPDILSSTNQTALAMLHAAHP